MFRTAALAVAFLPGLTSVATAQIYNWDTGEVIAGTEDITPGPGMQLNYWNTDDHNLRYADLSGGLDLHGSSFRYSWLDQAWFMGANLNGAHLYGAALTGANLSEASLRGVVDVCRADRRQPGWGEPDQCAPLRGHADRRRSERGEPD